MNKLNFDSLSRYKAPDEWIKKAAAIPEAPRKKRIVPLYRFAAVASIVLVSVIGLVVFLRFDSGKAPVVSHGSTGATDYGHSETIGETTDMSVPAETIAVPSTNAGIRYAEATEPTATITQTIETQNPSVAPITSQKATEKPSPTAPATERTITATEVSKETQPPKPTSPSPTAAPPTDPPLTDCRITVTTGYPSPAGEVPSIETDEPIVFCRMYDGSGDLVGSSSLFAEEKRATVVTINPDNSFVVTYDPLEKGLPITKGRYTYVMVDYFLGTELCRGTVEY